MQVVPTELLLKPGAKANFRVRLFDERGEFIREEPAAAWSLDKLQGFDCEWGIYGSFRMQVAQAGLVKATVGQCLVRQVYVYFPRCPGPRTFDSMAVKCASLHVGKYNRQVCRA